MFSDIRGTVLLHNRRIDIDNYMSVEFLCVIMESLFWRSEVISGMFM